MLLSLWQIALVLVLGICIGWATSPGISWVLRILTIKRGEKMVDDGNKALEVMNAELWGAFSASLPEETFRKIMELAPPEAEVQRAGQLIGVFLPRNR